MRTEALTIEVGQHIHWNVGGITLNGDTITSTIVAGVIVVALGLWAAHGASARNPSKIALFWESVIETTRERVDESLGLKTAPFVVPLGVSLFVFILIANWLSIIPTGHHPEYLPPPASDVNFTYALASIVFVAYTVTGLRKNGIRYYKFLFHGPKPLWPLNIIEELIKPVTLALRLFGNVFAGVIMVSLIALFPAYILWAPDVLWKLFDMAIGAIQAFIFGLLTILYFASVRPEPAHGSSHATSPSEVAASEAKLA